MLQPQMSFWGRYPEQVDPLWIELGFGLEAVLFNGEELTPENLRRFEEVIATFRLQGVDPITLHFPMNNANYLESPNVRDALWAFIDIARRNSIRGIVLHSNYQIEVKQLAGSEIDRIRARFLALYAEIDRALSGDAIWIGIENMPIMGNLGDDADAIFVYPQDFREFQFQHIKIVFDLCHWTSTVHTVKTWLEHPKNSHLYPPMLRCEMQDFLDLESQIAHLHLGAFQGIALPPRRAQSTEGYVPGEGSLSGQIYWELLKPFLASENRGLAFEVHELDYTRRREIWRTLGWFLQSGVLEKEHQRISKSV